MLLPLSKAPKKPTRSTIISVALTTGRFISRSVRWWLPVRRQQRLPATEVPKLLFSGIRQAIITCWLPKPMLRAVPTPKPCASLFSPTISVFCLQTKPVLPVIRQTTILSCQFSLKTGPAVCLWAQRISRWWFRSPLTA